MGYSNLRNKQPDDFARIVHRFILMAIAILCVCCVGLFVWMKSGQGVSCPDDLDTMASVSCSGEERIAKFLETFTYYGYKLGDVVPDSTVYGKKEKFAGAFSNYELNECSITEDDRIYHISLQVPFERGFRGKPNDPFCEENLRDMKCHFADVANEIRSRFGIDLQERQDGQPCNSYQFTNDNYIVLLHFCSGTGNQSKEVALMPLFDICDKRYAPSLTYSTMPWIDDGDHVINPERGANGSGPTGKNFIKVCGYELGGHLKNGDEIKTVFTNDIFGSAVLSICECYCAGRKLDKVCGMTIWSKWDVLDDLAEREGRAAFCRFPVELAKRLEDAYGIRFSPNPRKVHWGRARNAQDFYWQNDEVSIEISTGGAGAAYVGTPGYQGRGGHAATWIDIKPVSKSLSRRVK